MSYVVELYVCISSIPVLWCGHENTWSCQRDCFHINKIFVYSLNLQKEYKKALELEIRGKGLTELALETPDFVRAKNATDIASQVCVNNPFLTSDVFF